jgi:ABC-2 type transport system ATP-binding protein
MNPERESKALREAPALRAENLSKTFGEITAIDHIHFEVAAGKIVGLIGPDGGGKTTFLRLCASLLRPTEGRIWVDGLDVSKNPGAVKDRMGYIPQHFSLYGDLTVSENLKFFADLYGVPKQRFVQRKKELLRFSNLALFEDRLARNLSGGMQKKLALACNLFHTPKILFLDEPTTGVDPASRRELWQILFELNRSGVTILFATPYMDEAQRCHEVGFIFEGRILAYSPPQSLIEGMPDEVIQLMTPSEEARLKLKDLAHLKNIYPFGEALHLVFEQGRDGIGIARKRLEELGIEYKSLRRIAPSFEDVFLAMLLERRAAESADVQH